MSYQVTIEPVGITIEVEEDQTILDAAYVKGFGYHSHAVMAHAAPVKFRSLMVFMMLVKPHPLH